MINEEIIAKLKERYANVNPLMFHRSVEKATSPGDLFDILDSIPDKFPIIWCEESHCWVATEDIYQSEHFDARGRKDDENSWS